MLEPTGDDLQQAVSTASVLESTCSDEIVFSGIASHASAWATARVALHGPYETRGSLFDVVP